MPVEVVTENKAYLGYHESYLSPTKLTFVLEKKAVKAQGSPKLNSFTLKRDHSISLRIEKSLDRQL